MLVSTKVHVYVKALSVTNHKWMFVIFMCFEHYLIHCHFLWLGLLARFAKGSTIIE